MRSGSDPLHMSAAAGDAAAGSSRPSVAAAAAASQQQHEAALHGRYELLSLRGKGSFADVWEARHRRTGHKVAVKIISHARMQSMSLSTHKITREIRVMRLLRHHPHVIRFYDAVATRAHTYIVMELADAGQLYDHVVLRGRLPEDRARAIFHQLAAAVLYCHRSMVAHRDLKMENVLLLNMPGGGNGDAAVAVKVVDFGFSKVYTDGRPMRNKMGSPDYAAPELLGGAHGAGYVGPLVDVWSCGVILYGMLCGGLPFDGADVSDLARNVRRGHYRVPAWVSDDARDLIAGMLIVRPQKRMTMAEVMAHPWLLQGTAMPAYLAAAPPTPPPPPDIDEAVVEQLVTRHGFDRTSLLESLRRHQEQHQHHHHQEEEEEEDDDDDDDEAAVSYQLVLANMCKSDAAAAARVPAPD